MSPLQCYELCVQSPRHVVSLLRGVYEFHQGTTPRVLREDFAGSAAVSSRWVREGLSLGEVWRAVAVELDQPTIAHAREQSGTAREHVEFVHADAITCDVETTDDCDVIWVGNFSIGYIHQRHDLVEYLRRSRRRLAMGNAGFGGGIFACDIYGGAGAFALGSLERTHPSRGREMIKYLWQHEAADPRTGMVRNSISFRVLLDGEVIAEHPRAFVYDWRLWSLAELREAMLEAGFASVEVYKDINVAPGQPPRPVADPAELGVDWVVVVVAR